MKSKKKKRIDKLIAIVGNLIKEQKKIWKLQQFEVAKRSDLVVSQKTAVAYTDGSYNSQHRVGAYGIVMIMSDKVRKYSGKVDALSGIQIDSRIAEYFAVAQAINLACSLGVKQLVIKYDAKAASWLRDIVARKSLLIDINLVKVKAHSDLIYNEMADDLAGNVMRSLVGSKKVANKKKQKPAADKEVDKEPEVVFKGVNWVAYDDGKSEETKRE